MQAQRLQRACVCVLACAHACVREVACLDAKEVAVFLLLCAVPAQLTLGDAPVRQPAPGLLLLLFSACCATVCGRWHRAARRSPLRQTSAISHPDRVRQRMATGGWHCMRPRHCLRARTHSPAEPDRDDLYVPVDLRGTDSATQQTVEFRLPKPWSCDGAALRVWQWVGTRRAVLQQAVLCCNGPSCFATCWAFQPTWHA